MEDGFYAVKNGEVYKITPRIKMPIAKSVNVKTGVIHYPTNADRIRAMSDEELAAFHKSRGCPPLKSCPNIEELDGIPENGVCQKCWLDWLREEAEI